MLESDATTLPGVNIPLQHPIGTAAPVLAEARPRELKTSNTGIKELIVKAVWLVDVDASMQESPWAELRRSSSLSQLVYIAGLEVGW